jgi:DNA-binding NtrC family response regulator
MVDAGTFRADLYYRINCMQMELPPLRHRREDIPELVHHFLTHGGKRAQAITPEALGALARYDYPGNVRELRNILERAAILARGGRVDMGHLTKEVVDPNQAPRTYPLHEEAGFFVMPNPRQELTPAQDPRQVRRQSPAGGPGPGGFGTHALPQAQVQTRPRSDMTLS